MTELFSDFLILGGKEEMPTYKIRGIDVDFPFEAYDSQLVYMDKVIQSLQQVTLFIFYLYLVSHFRDEAHFLARI